MYHSVYLDHLKHNPFLKNGWFYQVLSQQLAARLISQGSCGHAAIIGLPETVRDYWTTVLDGWDISFVSYQTVAAAPANPMDWPFEKKTLDLCLYGPAWCWFDPFESALSTVRQSIKPGGVMLMVGIGQATTEDWLLPGVPSWPDMIEIGDALQQLDCLQVAISTITVTLTYSNIKQLVQDCQNHGLWVRAGNPSLSDWFQWAKSFSRSGSLIRFEVELVFAYAIAASERRGYQDASGRVHVSVDELFSVSSQG
ncbi:MAG: hypothetical protein CMF46_04810 [Legionellales bacterium]|nr:hypothetical protein [Legionellales bacterium]|tara:strand:- start:350 stop:1111 length:762 start_codon:yes stop_codon:yes gene_type:complete